jgi:hypothetical protein
MPWTWENNWRDLMGESIEVCGLGNGRDRSSNASVLAGWRKQGRSAQGVHEAILGMRILVDAGEVDWLKPRKAFGLRAMNYTKTLRDGSIRDIYALAQERYHHPPEVKRTGNFHITIEDA